MNTLNKMNEMMVFSTRHRFRFINSMSDEYFWHKSLHVRRLAVSRAI